VARLGTFSLKAYPLTWFNDLATPGGWLPQDVVPIPFLPPPPPVSFLLYGSGGQELEYPPPPPPGLGLTPQLLMAPTGPLKVVRSHAEQRDGRTVHVVTATITANGATYDVELVLWG
jgi:hypothetical protein